MIYCGFSLGFVAAGLVSGWLIPILGWRSVLVVGAVAPLLLLPALLRYLPDSLTSMINRGAEPNRIQAIFRKMDPALAVGPDITYEAEKRTDGQRTALRSLFTRDRVLGTLLLWLVFVINLGEFYALQSWLPSIMTSLDYDMGTVVTATTLTTVGGIAAAFVTGPCMDRLGAYVTLGTVYVVGFAFVALTGVAFTAPLWVLLTANFFAGVCISGGQKSLIALSAVFYPTPMRSTGVGWALGVGRLGGIVGPIAVGAALGMGWSASAVFYAMSVPMLVAGAAVFLLGRWVRSDNHPDRKSQKVIRSPASSVDRQHRPGDLKACDLQLGRLPRPRCTGNALPPRLGDVTPFVISRPSSPRPSSPNRGTRYRGYRGHSGPKPKDPASASNLGFRVHRHTPRAKICKLFGRPAWTHPALFQALDGPSSGGSSQKYKTSTF